MSKSLGERLVRVDFNVTNSELVGLLKTKTAELINIVHTIGKDGRCESLAITAYETAAMWAVKAATAPDPAPAARNAELA